MKLIVGLGNPGKDYSHTRHNVGFMFLDKLQKNNENFPEFTASKKLFGEQSKGKIKRTGVVLLKPDTFMNNSGQAVQAALNFYGLKPSDLIVIHDDKDIPLGETKVHQNRGSAGHNGVKSIVEQLGTQDFLRIRVGIAPAAKINDTSDFVLTDFSASEMNNLEKVFNNITAEINALVP